MEDGVWVTRDGEHIPVSLMKRSHIEFSIAKIKRDEWRLPRLPRLEFELKVRDAIGRKD